MTKVLLITENPLSAVSFYRSIMPWNKIQCQYDDVIVTTKHPNDHFEWDLLTLCDVVFMSNPRTSRYLDIMKSVKNFGIKIWSDFDDCYLDVPQDNPYYSPHAASHINQMVKECLSYSDITTVTTNYLKECFLPYTDRISIVPNAFPMEMLNDKSLGPITQATHNFVSWRGGDSHKRNLREYTEEIKHCALSNTSWVFKFFGMHPEFFDQKFKYNHHGYENIFESFYRLKKFSSKVHIVPLYERPFNLSKSNISWIEATIAGSVTLAPSWSEWQRPGIVNYTTKEDFKDKLNALLNGEYDLTRQFEESRDYILNNLSLEKINKERIKILSELYVR